MNQETFNIEIRRFLKRFGITSQHEIEKAVEAAMASGKLKGDESLAVHATLSIPGLLPELRIDGSISLAGGANPD